MSQALYSIRRFRPLQHAAAHACRYDLCRRAGMLAAALLAAGSAGISAAAEPVIDLGTMTVSATRSPHEVGRVPSSVSLLSLSELHEQQIDDLRTALTEIPGTSVINTGATGGATSLFIRGASSHQISLLVDGVRINDRSADYVNFLGGADLAGLGRVEILRGPQSTLYGGSAMGGVLLLETTPVDGTTGGAFSLRGGSLGTIGAAATARGGSEQLGYSGSLTRTHTANDRPRNNYDQWSYSTRVEGRPGDSSLVIGATMRGQQGEYEEPGSTSFPSEGDVDADSHLITWYAQFDFSENLRSRLTAGWHRRDYKYANEFFSTRQQNTRRIVDWQNTWQASPEIEVIAGLNWEDGRYTIDALRIDDDTRAGYLSVVATPYDDLTLTGGLRHDDFATGDATTTGRGGASWRPGGGNTALRGTYGTGFVAPGSADRFGVPAWGQLPSADLQPEESRGWDVGIDQYFAGGRWTVSATWFENHFRNLFDWETVDFTTFEGRIINRQRASTEGLELEISAQPTDALTLSASYTWLDARDDQTDQRLARRPRHVANLDARLRATSQLLVGAGVYHVGERIDAGAPLDDYLTARAYASYRWNDNLSLNARVENAFNTSYEEVRGYAALPRAWFGGLEWRY